MREYELNGALAQIRVHLVKGTNSQDLSLPRKPSFCTTVRGSSAHFRCAMTVDMTRTMPMSVDIQGPPLILWTSREKIACQTRDRQGKSAGVPLIQGGIVVSQYLPGTVKVGPNGRSFLADFMPAETENCSWHAIRWRCVVPHLKSGSRASLTAKPSRQSSSEINGSMTG